MSGRTMARQVLVLFFSLVSFSSVRAQVTYSVPEEMPRGSVVGNIAQDLGLEIKRLKSGKARIYTTDSAEHIELNRDRGLLLIKEKIDREALCGQTTPCALHFQIILENPMEFYSVTVEVTDINDNPPDFKKNEIKFKISESAVPGVIFLLERAVDPDVGMNDLQSYSLHPTDHFTLKLQKQADGGQIVEMVLQKSLDRENEEQMTLVLTALDGGDPQLTGTAQIHVTVLDANDNAPVFTQKVYKTSITENTAIGTAVIKVSANDADEGSNSKISYSIKNTEGAIPELFHVSENEGDLQVIGNIDYEKSHRYQILVQASDEGGLTDRCKIEVDVVDRNDNSPVINIMSKLNMITEDSKPGTVITMINVQDPDSGENGKVYCTLNENMPFTLKSTSNNFFSLVTDLNLDRERDSEYNISIKCADEGVPSLSSSITIPIQITDVNDNAPVFEKSSYETSVLENNTPGLSIFRINARDADQNQNAHVSYLLEDSSVNGVSVSSYVSVLADSGVVQAVRSFDYEQIKEFRFCVRAQDGGSPPLSSNVTVRIIIQDQNDNAPQILYPVQTGGSPVAEMVPRSADVGYLVTKVVAVDVDSGQNAWLSYKLLKVSDRALFEVGAQNGEIRTIRQVTDKDAVKQKLTVVVEDNGQSPRSATVTVNVAVADGFPELLSDLTDFTQDKLHNEDLTFYLILALAAVSFLFIMSLIAIISVKCYRWRRERLFYKSGANLPVIPYYPPLYADVGGTATLQHTYNYDVCRTTDSRKSDMNFLKPSSQSFMTLDSSGAQTLPHVHGVRLTHEEPEDQQKPPSADWRFPQNQRPGPSGQIQFQSTYLKWIPTRRAAATPEVAVGTGPWPNPPTEAEQLQALMAAANEVSEATNTLGPGTMGLSTRYSPQFTLQHVPDYRQNVYIPGSTATLTANPQQQLLQQQQQQQLAPQQALPPPQPLATQPEPPKAAQTPASKKKSTKKEKK
ncbi:protocadherin gamma-A2-like isoform X11 [Denticeps clupeoides]|uniref:protocadherin gamma-A2-like isoform X11 n=1 Tax=Denticeps clupeoides TaxID=299321 RepID=UPI0010A2E73F|nr:protocadherin gamma-A2-like isoform X11 [Denticeps clupeoides]